MGERKGWGKERKEGTIEGRGGMGGAKIPRTWVRHTVRGCPSGWSEEGSLEL